MKARIIFFLFALCIVLPLHAQFKGSFDFIATQQYLNGNVRSDTIQYFFAEEKLAIIIKAGGNQPDLRLLFQPADSTITGLFEHNGNKGGYILPMNQKYWPGMHYALQDYGTGPRTQLNYTGTQKEINGTVCNEIICESEKYDASLFIAPEVELSLVQVLAYQSVGAGEGTEAVDFLSDCGVQGFAVESTIKDKTRNATITLTIKNISPKIPETVFNTKGFQLSEVKE
ncbi:hypothetical protein [Marinirhabdus gelatinilytica]|uniref:DUF4412 domain-containing protein n=1 Tax=Marinirhabdus gelatinilytica TaxID=1703343 RepID=A0A370QF47_9FLAO|nr:hypothetical protein [Marinirhabdus gelatinilytica]RDK86992.1 hypothetical protein C8D94_102170 [Marinirhabdus gelatinilytica]